jgi:hypothetical protein
MGNQRIIVAAVVVAAAVAAGRIKAHVRGQKMTGVLPRGGILPWINAR